MYYSVHAAGGRHCLSAAMASSPANQFVDTSTKPMLCMPNGETIDPATVIGPYNLRYLIWKGPDAKGVATIYSQRLTSDGLGFVGPRAVLMKAKPGTWTSYNVEAPSMLFTQNRWFLFYSGGNYWSPKYAIGYATCSGPLGPCTDRNPKTPWVGSHGARVRPGRRELLRRPQRGDLHGLPRLGQAPGLRQGRHPLALDRPGRRGERGPALRGLGHWRSRAGDVLAGRSALHLGRWKAAAALSCGGQEFHRPGGDWLRLRMSLQGKRAEDERLSRKRSVQTK